MKIAKRLSWLIVVAGLWQVLAPFILSYSETTVAMWNAIIVGVVLIASAIWAANSDKVSIDKNLDRVNAVLGLWLIVAPFILGYSATVTAMWNDIIVGLVVIVMGVWATLVVDKPVSLQH